MTCCFFGHKDAPSSIYEKLEEAVEKLIKDDGYNSFLVGNQGQFDSMALSALRKMKGKYPHISYNIVLAYMPGHKEEWSSCDPAETVFPEGLESVHPRYAISWRNKWMVQESDAVVCYITHSWGGAAQYVNLAERRNKLVVNLALAK